MKPCLNVCKFLLVADLGVGSGSHFFAQPLANFPAQYLGTSEQVCLRPERILRETMAGDSSRKKWWKRLGAGGRHSADSKSQDGAPQHVTALEHVATASSADPSTGTGNHHGVAAESPSFRSHIPGNTVLVPKQGGLSSTTVSLPLRPSADASIPTPPGVSPTSSGTALSVPQTKNGDGTPEILQMVVGSLWDRAYDLLRDEEPDRVAAYESLLSEVLARGMCPNWLAMPSLGSNMRM